MLRYLGRILIVITALMLPINATAGLIRDAEVEATLRAYSTPIFAAADIPPESVRMFIVSNPQINAYVAGGLNIFIHTGLIMQAKNPGMLIGVIAHETGHIAGAHLSQFREKSNRALIGNIIGAVAGAAAVLGGAGQAGAGIIAGSQSMATRNFIGEIRANEAAADQAMLSYLDANEISASGALEMFQILQRMELGAPKRDQFMSDHPLSSERITAMRNHIADSAIPKGQIPPQFVIMHARMVAKLTAFIEPYETTLARYPESNTSVAARYARAIAAFKHSNAASAQKQMALLIHENPNDPYFYDTLGQIQFETGQIQAAIQSYEKAATLLPKSPLILTEYAKVLIAENNPKTLSHAMLLLERSRDLDDSYDVTWRQIALGFARLGKTGLSYQALAEEAALHGDYRTCLQHISRARVDAKTDPALTLALDDLERDALVQLEKTKQEESLF